MKIPALFKRCIFLFLFHALLGEIILAQTRLSVEQAIESAIKSHPQILLASKEVDQQKILKKGSLNISKTDLWLESPTGTRFAPGIQQYLSLPNVYVNQVKLQNEHIKLSEKNLEVNKNLITKNVRLSYLSLQYFQTRQSQLKYQDSIYKKLFEASEKKFNAGDVGYMEKLSAETKYFEIRNDLRLVLQSLENAEAQLLMLMGQTADSIIVTDLVKYNFGKISKGDTNYVANNPTLTYFQQYKSVSGRNLKMQRSLIYPDVFFGYLNQAQKDSPVLYRFRFGISVPLWFPYYTSKIKAAKMGVEIANLQYQTTAYNTKAEYLNAYTDYNKSNSHIGYFEDMALKQSGSIIETSAKLFNAGEINYINYLQSLSYALQIKMDYISAIKDYNTSIINLEYLQGK